MTPPGRDKNIDTVLDLFDTKMEISDKDVESTSVGETEANRTIVQMIAIGLIKYLEGLPNSTYILTSFGIEVKQHGSWTRYNEDKVEEKELVKRQIDSTITTNTTTRRILFITIIIALASLIISWLDYSKTNQGHKEQRRERRQSRTSDEKRELLNLEYEWLNKEFALDTAFLSSIMDSTFIGVSDNGIKNKQEDLISMYNNIDQRIKNGIVIDSFRLEDEVVNIYSNSAVVTFIVHTYRHNNDTLIERKTRFYDVWIKRGDKWRAVSSQGTPIQE